ncbi:hypothetical protein MKW98_006412 [Papaver atlanticum]|uniref:Pentatricopeptide repeat-containing protein n=1 Tax=Papaver atlanticum TaxID=357466 RepID=A0AAD4RVV7_9MAGN|nr:hypothetical protein MKW98_006412 [Papaver atlanticum]
MLVTEAPRMFDESEHEADVICWNAIIVGCLKCGDLDSAIGLFESMPDKNSGPWNVMISGYAKTGKIEIAQDAMIDGYITGSYFKEALRSFHEMQMNGVRPRKYVLSSVLAACAGLLIKVNGFMLMLKRILRVSTRFQVHL